MRKRKMWRRKSFLILVMVVVAAAVLFVGKRVRVSKPAFLPTGSQGVALRDQQVGEKVEFLRVADGFKMGVFAKGIENARDLEFSPDGTLLVSSTKQGKIFALPDKNSDGRADENKVVLSGLAKPHGLAFHDGNLFVAEETRVVRYSWNGQKLTPTQDKVLFSLPGSSGGHFTRSIVFGKDGKMYVSIGSTCNVCHEKHEWLAAIIVSDADGNDPRVYARGLRNSVFMTVHPATGELWATEMGRDLLGDNLPPDEINIVREGAPSTGLRGREPSGRIGSGPRDYGWPFCYGSRVADSTFPSQLRKARPCEATEAPVYEIAAHSAPLGLTFVDSIQFPDEWQGDLLVAYHGSWNRSTPIGYKIVRLKVDGEKVAGEEDFIAGFIPSNAEGGLLAGKQAHGRPVDLIFDEGGALYISDDKAGVIYKVVGQ